MNKNGLPDLLDWGEALQQDPKKPSRGVGTVPYLSYILSDVYMWENFRWNEDIDHNLHFSDVMSLGLTIIALMRLKEAFGLNVLDSYGNPTYEKK